MRRKANRRRKVSYRQNTDSNIEVPTAMTLPEQQNKGNNSSLRMSLQQQIENQTSSNGKNLPKQNIENNASVGLAPPREEMSLAARRLASPCEKTPLNARGLAPPSGSRLSATDVSMPPSPDTPAWVCTCTPARVPSPKRGVAGQTQTGMRAHFMAVECRPSIIESLRKDAKNIETNTELNCETNHETNTELNYGTDTELDYETTTKPNNGTILHSLRSLPSYSISKDLSKTRKKDRNVSKKQCSNITKAIQGSMHQGSYTFGENAGNQCVPNCLIAGIFLTTKPVHVWTSEDMDNILMTGNELYSFLRASSLMNHNHLLVHELPRQIEVFYTFYNIHIDESKVSMISSVENLNQDLTNFNALPLDEAIQLSLEKYPTAFVCFAGNTMLIGRTDFGVFIFDSHSRSETGMIDIDGKSTCLLMTDLKHISERIHALGESMNISGAIMIEITGFKVENVHSSSDKHESNVQLHSQRENILDDDDAVKFSFKEAPIKPDFKLLCKGTQKQICSTHDLKYENNKVHGNKLIKNAEEPKTWHRVKGDGNCFFRALSFALSNTEENHVKLRELVCEHASSQPDVFTPILRVGHESVLSYLETTKMREDCVWATEFEIFVASGMLDCTIYTFNNGTWTKFAMPSENKRNISDKNKIFLDHVNSSHYDVVLSTGSETAKDKNNSNRFQGLREMQRKRKDTKERDVLRKRLKKHEELIDENNDNVSGLDTPEIHIVKDNSVDTNVENSLLDNIRKNCKRKLRYMNDETYRDTRKKISKRTYEENDAYRGNKKSSNMNKYKENIEHREKLKERSVMKYLHNEEHRKHVKEASVSKYRENEEHKEKVKLASFTKYKENVLYKKKKIEASVLKYKENQTHRANVREKSISKYKNDEDHKRKVKSASISRYWEDGNFRSKLKEQSLNMYHDNETFRINAKRKSMLQNIKNERHKSRARQTAKEKYATDKKYRSQKLECARKKYKDNTERIPDKRKVLSEKKRSQRILQSRENSDVQLIIANFQSKAKEGPEFACSCCKRLCFENQVVSCCFEAYAKKGHNVTKAATMSITHNSENSTGEGQDDCFKICHTCQRKIMTGCTPPESSSNHMNLDKIPDELISLNSLEENLIAKHITFMKLAMLPQGTQNAIQGPVVCVPSNLNKAASLPRQEDNDLILRVKLKRKLSYKGHYDFKFVNTSHVYNALQYLKENNIWYKDTDINQPDPEENNCMSVSTSNEQNDEIRHKDNTTNCSNIRPDKIPHEENEPSDEYGVQYDTCLQPPDIGQEVLDHYFDEVFNIAPAEGMNPIRMLQEKGNEAKCFPVLFPTGKNSYDEARNLPITLSRYFNTRLMHADNRFAQNTNYLFYAQYLSELKQVIDKTQISLRKTDSKGTPGGNVTAETLRDKAKLKQMFRKDEALRFLQPIRGTPSYWQSAQKDLFAMLRQLGIPTWFCSFSAAEFRWKDMINAILKRQGDTRKFENLEWSDKCQILKSNPVTVARMFDRRFHLFLHEVILSPCNPIGKVVDFFLRVEFQQRGSPHMHCLFWIADAPRLNENDEETVCAFIDRYVTCELPHEKDQELHGIVQGVQQHSKKHSKSCRKKGTTCRFNFPRPPSSRTCIISPLEEKTSNAKKKDSNTSQLEASSRNNEENDSYPNETMTKTDALGILKRVWDAIQSDSVSKSDTESLLEMIGTDQATYQQAQRIVATRQNIVLKRKPNEVWINQYNPTLLKCWDANMDIQFILDPFSCIVYVISYISKAEREMGMIYKQTKIESEEGNLNAHQTMKAVGSAYLHHREVGVQEAVYRVCGLKMKESSRKVVFIPVGENPTRLSKPLSQLQGNENREDKDDMTNSNEDTEEIWMLNVIDRYEARPNIQEFEKMCLAVFCSVFRVLSKSQVPKKQNVNVFKLRDDKGFIQRRVRSDHAVIRYPPTNISRDPEKHWRSILQLFLPYWTQNQLKPPGFDLYKSFYETGCVRFKDDKTLNKVQEVVDRNRDLFIKSEEALVEAQELYDLIGEPTDAWAMICPESERCRDECRLMKSLNTADDGLSEDISDLQPDHKPDITYTIQGRNASKEEILPVLRSLNSKQSEVFYFTRDWCLKKLQGQNADPFHIFITGGAGTGKSHLIKAIKYEASRILAKVCEEPDQLTVLLTAFTGTAAFNIQGCTVHHAFRITRGLPLPYEALKEQTLSPLRAKLENLQILVIDEVSMIYKRLLYYIHERLVQIKRNKSPFGGVSVLAVGDFFQLPPVKQSKNERLYNVNTSYPVDYWNDFFSVIELDEIMRQRKTLNLPKF